MLLRLAVGALLVVAGCAAPGGLFGPELRLQVFDCGRMQGTEEGIAELFGIERYQVETDEIFVPCYLVEHPDGLLLWDGGLPPGFADAPDGVPLEGGGTMRLAKRLDVQLAEQGRSPADVDLVAFSHMHFDHVGHANLFGASKLLIQRAEFEAAFVPEPGIPFMDRELYTALDHAEKELLDGDHDVFGDGRVRILSAPGHTPGHQVLFVDLAKTGPVVLSGDLYHLPVMRRERLVPPFNVDREQTLASMDRIEAFLAESGAELWIEHDAERAAKTRLAPAFYD